MTQTALMQKVNFTVKHANMATNLLLRVLVKAIASVCFLKLFIYLGCEASEFFPEFARCNLDTTGQFLSWKGCLGGYVDPLTG